MSQSCGYHTRPNLVDTILVVTGVLVAPCCVKSLGFVPGLLFFPFSASIPAHTLDVPLFVRSGLFKSAAAGLVVCLTTCYTPPSKRATFSQELAKSACGWLLPATAVGP